MALYTTPDGRVIVGSGIDNGNDYHGFNGKRDIVIQLTADGATTAGLNALEYLKSYAENAKKENKPIFPDGTRVFISANGYTKAVEADDVVIDGDNITIGGIVWNGSAWDYTNAGQSGGGSGGDSNVFIVNATFDYDENDEWSVTLDKTFSEISAASNAGKIVLCIPYESVTGYNGYPCVMTVESNEAFANTDVDPNDGTVYSFSFGIDTTDDTYAYATTWSKGGGGSGSGVFVVNAVRNNNIYTLDQTWQDIRDADFAVVKIEPYGTRLNVIKAGKNLEGTEFSVLAGNGVEGSTYFKTYKTTSASGYPTEV